MIGREFKAKHGNVTADNESNEVGDHLLLRYVQMYILSIRPQMGYLMLHLSAQYRPVKPLRSSICFIAVASKSSGLFGGVFQASDLGGPIEVRVESPSPRIHSVDFMYGR